jgi:hypothetical protein
VLPSEPRLLSSLIVVSATNGVGFSSFTSTRSVGLSANAAYWTVTFKSDVASDILRGPAVRVLPVTSTVIRSYEDRLPDPDLEPVVEPIGVCRADQRRFLHGEAGRGVEGAPGDRRPRQAVVGTPRVGHEPTDAAVLQNDLLIELGGERDRGGARGAEGEKEDQERGTRKVTQTRQATPRCSSRSTQIPPGNARKMHRSAGRAHRCALLSSSPTSVDRISREPSRPRCPC